MEIFNFFANINGHNQVKTSQNGFKDFPFSLDFVWILGKKYNTIHDIDDLRASIRSKIWFSYRSGFPPIGGTGPTSDKHWGCMLRCGQMVMAEALIQKHLGKGWQWYPGVINPIYRDILRKFQDNKKCPYSIHQIAQMGVSQGKACGQWFGPNTVAQVLSKLSFWDEMSSLAVYVASASAVIKKDVYTICQYVPHPATPQPPETMNSHWYTDCIIRRQQSLLSTLSISDSETWRSMLLFIPLRLGISDMNPIYFTVLKNTFTMKQSLGILGGKPRHAVWFIGFTGDDLICLDPHTTQPAVDLFDDDKFDDSTFHVPYGGSKRMHIKDLDPSLSLCFYFETKDDFEDWCSQVKKILIPEDNHSMFEILDERPKHWPPLDLRPDLNCSSCSLDYDFVTDGSDILSTTLSDDDFENVEAASCSFRSLDQDFSLL